MSNGNNNFNADQTVDDAPCAGQTTPSPQCPQTKKENEEQEEQPETLVEPTEDGAPDSASGSVQLTTYEDGEWGKITISPSTMKKGIEAQLAMTFTATKTIDLQNTSINMTVDFPPPNTGFELNEKIEVSPSSAQNFFERAPSVFTSDVTNKATILLMKMTEGEQFTITFTITPQQDFNFKAYTSTIIRQFKNSRGELPKITVYSGNTPPVITHDLSPVYINSKLKMRLRPWPHSIAKDTDTELTLTFTAVSTLQRKSIGQNGQRTHDVAIGISPSSAVSDRENYRVMSVSTWKYFKNGKQPQCSLAHNCRLKIVEMKKGESFVLKLIVNASKNFSIGSANGIAMQLRKKADGMNSELDNKPPLIEVR